MKSIIIDDDLKKKFEGIRGKFLSTGLFMNLTRAETLELMIDILNSIDDIGLWKSITPFDSEYIKKVLEKRKEKK